MMVGQPNSNLKDVHNVVHWVKDHVYDPCGISCSTPIPEPESAAYGASTFSIDGKNVHFRVAKITPTKAGQFVTVWKRNADGITEPFTRDDLDFIIVTTLYENKIGQFLFPASALVIHGVISERGKNGKRGIRIYPPWDKTNNKQAQKTQQWQLKFFVDFTTEIDFQQIKRLLQN